MRNDSVHGWRSFLSLLLVATCGRMTKRRGCFIWCAGCLCIKMRCAMTLCVSFDFLWTVSFRRTATFFYTIWPTLPNCKNSHRVGRTWMSILYAKAATIIKASVHSLGLIRVATLLASRYRRMIWLRANMMVGRMQLDCSSMQRAADWSAQRVFTHVHHLYADANM